MDELVAIDDIVQTGESSQAWTIDRWDTDFDGNGNYEIIAHGPGSSGADEIYTGIQTYFDAGDDYYNWKMFGMTGFAAGQIAELQPGCTQGNWPSMLLWNDPIDYWFLGNGRRIVVITKTSTSYDMMYLGFALPYGLPNQFPYPLVVGGSFCGSGLPHYSSVTTAHRGFANPFANAAEICTADPNHAYLDGATLKVLQGTGWIKIFNVSTITSFQRTNVVWPYICSMEAYAGSDEMPYNIFMSALRENIDGSYPIFPLTVMIENPNNHIYGELQGCFAVPGFGGLAAEDTLTVNGDTYIAFPIVPNASRIDFMCIKKE